MAPGGITAATGTLRGSAEMRLGAAVLALAAFTGAAPRESGLEVRASKRGFEPAAINLRKGEPARLVLKAADEEHCFAVDEFRIEKRVVPGRPTTLDFTPDRAGSFTFYCCLEPDSKALKGRLIVDE